MNRPQKTPSNPSQESSKAPAEDIKDQGTLDKKKQLDIASLDLTIEKVEERISPSETNVFDK